MDFTKSLVLYSDNLLLINDAGLQKKYSDLLKDAEFFYKSINERCLIFILCKNNYESLVGYFSCLSNRVVPLLLDSSINESLLNDLILKYKPNFIWGPKENFVEFEPVLEMNDYVLYKTNYSDTILFPDLGLLLTTSGSTGSAKLVRLSYTNVFANANSIAEYLKISENERAVTVLPMHYSFGLSIINSHILHGASILLTEKTLFDRKFWDIVSEGKATSLSGVPYTFEILKKLRFFNLVLPSLKTITQAGGKLSLELSREYSMYAHKNNKRFFVMYGQTEATARMSYLPHEYSMEKLGSIGIAIPGGEFSLIDDNGEVINQPNFEGELVYKGKNVSLGYAECASDLEKGDENLGVLFTGDIAKRDVDGFYYIVGRKKRFVKIFGNRVSLDELEQLLKPVVVDCACVGTDDLISIFIANSVDETNIIKNLVSKTGLNAKAFRVKQIPQIPKNSSGKTEYAKLNIM